MMKTHRILMFATIYVMKKVLIVEDDSLLMQMYSETLAVKYQVVKATDGKTGIEMVESEKPDLVLLDIMLPGGMNGFDVLENLKHSELTKNIPVIVHTSLDSEARTAESIGADAYFVKSKTQLGELSSKVDELLK